MIYTYIGKDDKTILDYIAEQTNRDQGGLIDVMQKYGAKSAEQMRELNMVD